MTKTVCLGLLALLPALCTQCHYLHVPPSYHLVLDGNSLVANAQGQFSGPLADRFRHDLHKHWQSGRVDLHNLAVGGQTTKMMLADASTQVDSICALPSLKRNILVVWENYNDLRVDAACTGPESFARMKAYCEGRKAANPTLLIVVGTPPLDKSRLAAWPTSPTFEARRQACRRLLLQARAQHAPWLDALADVGGDNAIDPADPKQSPDGIHYSDEGYVPILNDFERAINEAVFVTR